MLKLTIPRAERILSTLRAEFGPRASRRVAEMVMGAADHRRIRWPGRQRCDTLFMPRVPTQPWYDPSAFAFTSVLEDAAEAIARECKAVSEDLEYYLGDDHTRTPLPSPDELSPPAHGWKAFFLRRSGVWRRENCRRCPITTSIVKDLPLSAGDVMFSVLAPRSKIVPHHGLTNLDLTCHLGLEVPEDCALEVDGEARTWEEGRTMIFDDTFRHWAWNRSHRPRRVLLFDFWHPLLSADERAQLKRIFPLLFDSAPDEVAAHA